MKKKVLLSHMWDPTDVPHIKDFIAKLEAKGCEINYYPKKSPMRVSDLKEWLPGYYAHICCSDEWTDEAMDYLKDIKIISRIGVGFETVDIPAATSHGIAVTTTPGAGAEAVSEFVVASMLAMSRKLFQNDKVARSETQSGSWNILCGSAIYRKTLGIVGLGMIGKQLAKWVKSFDMKVISYDPFKDEEYAKVNNITYVSLDDLLKTSDFVSLHLPLMKSTYNLIGEKELGLMKPTAKIINASRGGIINEIALYNALKNHVIEAAALDVFEKEPINLDNPLLTLDNIILSPHAAGTTFEGVDSIIGAAFQNVAEIIDGKVPAGIRNPEVFKV